MGIGQFTDITKHLHIYKCTSMGKALNDGQVK